MKPMLLAMQNAFRIPYGLAFPKINCSQTLYRSLWTKSEVVRGFNLSAFSGIGITVDSYLPIINEDGTLTHGFMYDGERIVLLADSPALPFTTA